MARHSKVCGGKGNRNMFIGRDPKICAAGLPYLDHESVSSILPCYLLQDHVNSLLNDTIQLAQQNKLPQIKTPKRDMRNASIFSEGTDLINPPMKTKFQNLVEDFKNTLYTSYWKKEVGKVPDPKPNLPNGLNVYATTMGKKNPPCPRAYDVILPKYPIKGQVPHSKRCSYQSTRNYCSFDANQTFGMKTKAGSSSKQVKCCLTDDRIRPGNISKKPMSTIQGQFIERTTPKLGVTLDPNNNIDCVPEGFAFGKIEPPGTFGVPDCLSSCKISAEKSQLKKCLEHLNTLRKCMSKRYEGSFFPTFFLRLKYLDVQHTGWLPKEVVYKCCTDKYIRFNPALLEPLLSMWKIFDGSQIEYRTFVQHVLNYREPIPELPKIKDISDECLDFRTTYSEMCNYRVESVPKYMAGLPSGRYFDKDYPVTPSGCCRADRVYLPHESDARSCLCPSLLTLLGVSHRDMYAKRDPGTVRKIFENAGEEFTDQSFESLWKRAKKYHSQGWVCFETFRRALEERK
ncbi:unnamed protein product [Leptosia nina]|uniref:EFHB C-terminal EF-hand domain-containing protein n=1 Tax=Leptosia nina TaxID=320188 RepID=A0AAV1JSQ3_9NEOP